MFGILFVTMYDHISCLLKETHLNASEVEFFIGKQHYGLSPPEILLSLRDTCMCIHQCLCIYSAALYEPKDFFFSFILT